jgi:hypothetical protein
MYAWAGLDLAAPIYASCGARVTGACHHAQFYWLRWGLANFFADQTAIFLIYAYQEASIIVMSQCTQHLFLSFPKAAKTVISVDRNWYTVVVPFFHQLLGWK